MHPAGANPGYLDITSPPWNIDNSGTTDVTKRLQDAINFAHNNFLALYFPQGIYLVSDTLTAWQNESWTVRINNTHPCRFQPHVFIGERPGISGARPVIRLADNAPKFQNISQRLPVVDFTNVNISTHPAVVTGISFNQLFKGIDIEVATRSPRL